MSSFLSPYIICFAPYRSDVKNKIHETKGNAVNITATKKHKRNIRETKMICFTMNQRFRLWKCIVLLRATHNLIYSHDVKERFANKIRFHNKFPIIKTNCIIHTIHTHTPPTTRIFQIASRVLSVNQSIQSISSHQFIYFSITRNIHLSI